METITPVKLELALAVQQEIDEREAETGRLYQMQVERARYESTLAERRYKAVDPDNRLVAGTLEAEWNDRLRLVREAEQEYERLRLARQAVTAQTREQILRLADDFPQMWQDPQTPDRERKRMARLLIEDITLVRSPEHVTAHIRFKGRSQPNDSCSRPATKHRSTSGGRWRNDCWRIITTMHPLPPF